MQSFRGLCTRCPLRACDLVDRRFARWRLSTSRVRLLSVESGLFSLRPVTSRVLRSLVSIAGFCSGRPFASALHACLCHLPSLFHLGAVHGVFPFGVCSRREPVSFRSRRALLSVAKCLVRLAFRCRRAGGVHLMRDSSSEPVQSRSFVGSSRAASRRCCRFVGRSLAGAHCCMPRMAGQARRMSPSCRLRESGQSPFGIAKDPLGRTGSGRSSCFCSLDGSRLFTACRIDASAREFAFPWHQITSFLAVSHREGLPRASVLLAFGVAACASAASRACPSRSDSRD